LFDSGTCAGAAAAGQLLALQHLRREGCDWDVKRIAGRAASSGSMEMLEWLTQQQGIEINAGTMAGAASGGQTDMSICAALGSEWDQKACSEAATSGHLDTLRWLRALRTGCERDWY
jgi:hypothetical protein